MPNRWSDLTCSTPSCAAPPIGAIARRDRHGATFMYLCRAHAGDAPTTLRTARIVDARRWATVRWEPLPEQAAAS